MQLGNVLVTGGAGFFSRHFVRHLLENNLSDRICIYSRDEYKQSVMREEFKDDPRLRFFIGDVRDLPRLKRAMHGIDLCIHAAALKRIETACYNPDEFMKTNIIGSQNVIDATFECGVSRVVFLSTDKAFQPVSAYGYSKAMAECLFLAANNVHGKVGPMYSVTRYGNVAGSTGSIIPKWREILKTETIVPVTDPDATRFWMTPQEAVDLVMETVTTMEGGEVVIPDLPAYRVGDLALALTARMDIIGLPAHEKKAESMNGKHSNEVRQMNVDEIREALREV